MRWRSREEPWGSHHDDARALKWEISVGLTELVVAEEDRDRSITKVEGRLKIVRALRRVRRRGIFGDIRGQIREVRFERLLPIFFVDLIFFIAFLQRIRSKPSTRGEA